MDENQNKEVTDQVNDSAADKAVDTKGAQTSPSAEGTAESKDSAQTKTYDQAYIDKLLFDQKAAQAAAVAEALKVAKMDETSKADYEKQKVEKELSTREESIALRELKVEAREVLNKNDVPQDFLDILVGKDLEETKANVTAFKSKFDVAVQAQVEKRLVGKTPQNGNSGKAGNDDSAMAAEIAKYMS